MGLWGKFKGILYIGAIAGPGVIAFQQNGGMKNPAKAATNTIMAYSFMNSSTNKFDPAVGAQMWGPVLVLTLADAITGSSGLNLQKKISTGLRAFKA